MNRVAKIYSIIRERKAGRIADEILRQLGGRRFIAMTGAKDLVDGGKYLAFKLPGRGFSKYNYIKITLNSLDLYDIELGNIRRKKGVLDYKKQKVERNIYADMMVELLEKHTGLRFRL